MKSLTWMARHPELYRQERKSVESRFPSLTLCETALEAGALMYHGEIDVRTSKGTSKKKIRLLYPHMYPVNPPNVAVIASLPLNEPHGDMKKIIVSARHQMSDGNLCAVERDPFQEGGSVVRGIDVLKRAKQWFFSLESGHYPHDSVEADIESHLFKSGDILLGPEFYSDELGRGGHFYMAPYRSGSMISNKFVGLAFSSDLEEIVKFKDCRKTLDAVFPWISEDVWDTAENLAAKPANFRTLLEGGKIIKGFWWNLDEEPPPPRNGLGLLSLICNPDDKESLERVLSFFSTELSVEEFLYIGLRYPDRNEGFDWLFCKLRLRPSQEKNPLVGDTARKLELIKKAPITALFRHSVRKRELMLRNQGQVPASLAEKRISLFGVGSVGSTIAELLAKAGVGDLKLFDFDFLKTGNVIRHQSGIEFFGEPKVYTTYWKLVQHNPFSTISTYQWNLSESYQTLDHALSECDIVLSSTANEPLETAVNEIAVLKGQTVYYARAMRGGTVGRIFRVIPGKDACRYCLTRYMKDASSDDGKWLDVPEVEDTLLSFECGNPILAASGVDLTIISSLCTKIVLEDIKNDFGQNNHWLWTSQEIEAHPALDRAYNLSARRFAPFPDCLFCSKPPVDAVIIPQEVKSKIEELAANTGKNETGGILIGYFDDEKNAVITGASDAGPNAVCTPTKFLKDVPYTQKWLEDRMRESPRQIEYIGEWHSHTNGETTPSTTDIDSLNGITVSTNYLCQTPVMLIVGSNGAGGIIKTSAYGFAHSRPFREIGYKTLETNSKSNQRED